MTEPLLEIKGVRKQFGGLSALAGLDMHVDPGEILSVIGPNGAGKSTLFNVITGLYAPDDGDIRFRGESIVGLRPHQVAKLGIARTFQNVHLFPNMTVLENAMVGQHCRSKSGIFGSVLRLPSTRREEERIRDRARRTPSTSSVPGSPATARSSRRSRSRTRTAAGSRWLGPWRPIPRSCCWTSRRPG